MPVQCWKDSRKMRSWHLETFSGFRWKPPGKAVKLSWKIQVFPRECQVSRCTWNAKKTSPNIPWTIYNYESMTYLSNTRQKVRFKLKVVHLEANFRHLELGIQANSAQQMAWAFCIRMSSWNIDASMPCQKNPGLAESISVPLSAPGIQRLESTETPICDVNFSPRNGTHSADRNCNQSRPSPQWNGPNEFPHTGSDFDHQARGPRLSSVCGPTTHRKMEPVVDCTNDTSLICCWRHLTPKIWGASEISKPPETDSQGTLVIAFSEASEKHDIARKDFSASNCQTLCGLIKTRWNLQIASKTFKLFLQC